MKKPFLPFLRLSTIMRLEPKQVLQVSPQMLLATRMLLMPAQELSDYLARAAEGNPLLERSDEEEVRRYLKQKLRQAQWMLSCLEKRQHTLHRHCAWSSGR